MSAPKPRYVVTCPLCIPEQHWPEGTSLRLCSDCSERVMPPPVVDVPARIPPLFAFALVINVGLLSWVVFRAFQ